MNETHPPQQAGETNASLRCDVSSDLRAGPPESAGAVGEAAPHSGGGSSESPEAARPGTLTLIPYLPRGRVLRQLWRATTWVGGLVVAWFIADRVSDALGGGELLFAVTLLGLFVAGGAAGSALRGRWARRVLSRLSAAGLDDDAIVLRVLERARPDLSEPPPMIIRLLAFLSQQAAAFGKTFAALTRDEAQQVRVLDAPFGPVPLRGDDPAFRALYESHALAETNPAEPHAAPPAPVAARRWRWSKLTYGLVIVFVGLWLNSGLLVAIGAIPLGAALLSYRLRHSMYGHGTPEQWHLVPGGLALLSPSGSGWEVRVLDRRASVLLAYPLRRNRKHWLACVTDGREYWRRLLSPAELRLLLAAWLSPLTPPQPEQFSDLDPS